MYRLKNNIKVESLRKYGFRLGKEYPDSERCICNKSDREDFWLISLKSDDTDKIRYADENFDQPIWSIHVQRNRRLWIDCTPSGTYHIDNIDMERMFHVIYLMILDGIIVDKNIE